MLAEIEKVKAFQQEPAQAAVEPELIEKVAEEEPSLEEVDVEEQARLLAEFENKKATKRAPSQEAATKEQRVASICIKLWPRNVEGKTPGGGKQAKVPTRSPI